MPPESIQCGSCGAWLSLPADPTLLAVACEFCGLEVLLPAPGTAALIFLSRRHGTPLCRNPWHGEARHFASPRHPIGR